MEEILKTKNSYYQVPESEHDFHPKWQPSETDPSPFSGKCPLVKASDILSQDKETFKKMVKGMQSCGVVMVEVDQEMVELVKKTRDASVKYFASDDKSKEKRPKEKMSGYTKIFFTNRDNIRDPEMRDVFQVRLSDGESIPWPTEHPDIKETSSKLYEKCWEICSASFFGLIQEALQVDASDDRVNQLFCKPGEELKKTEESNLCLFHYFDKFDYKKEQNCMVHRDSGLVTLLPKATFPGIHVLDEEKKQWVHMEELTEPNQFLLYCGRAMEYISGGAIPALVHRVGRLPHVDRYSFPFELKPDNEATLHILNGEEKEGDQLYTGQTWENHIRFEATMGKVARADSVLKDPKFLEEQRLSLSSSSSSSSSFSKLNLKIVCAPPILLLCALYLVSTYANQGLPNPASLLG